MKYDLAKAVMKSEFPQDMKLKPKKGKHVILSFKNGQNVIISNENNNGNYDSEIYEFNNVDDNVVWPDSPEFPDYLARLNLDLFDGVANSDSRDDYNNNIKHIQEAMNSMIDYSTNQKTYFGKLKNTLNDLKGFILKLINLSVAKYMHDEVEVKYYKKEDVDKKIDDLQAQINNLTNAVTYKPDGSKNSVFPPSYTGDRDINDKISDAVIKQHVENLSNEDMKGDNN